MSAQLPASIAPYARPLAPILLLAAPCRRCADPGIGCGGLARWPRASRMTGDSSPVAACSTGHLGLLPGSCRLLNAAHALCLRSWGAVHIRLARNVTLRLCPLGEGLMGRIWRLLPLPILPPFRTSSPFSASLPRARIRSACHHYARHRNLLARGGDCRLRSCSCCVHQVLRALCAQALSGAKCIRRVQRRTRPRPACYSSPPWLGTISQLNWSQQRPDAPAAGVRTHQV